MDEETEFDRYLTPEQYQARNVGRGQVMEDLETLQGLQQTGGPAVEEARALQQEQAKGQIALQRGMDTGGRGERMGQEAAAKSEVESQAPIAMIKEAATQGYAREEVGAAGLLAMSDTQFKQAIKGFLGEEKRRQMRQGQGKTAAIISGGASGAAMGSTFGPVGAIFGGLGGAALAAAKTGGVVPGVGSEDTFPARLAPGEIVIPKELSAQLMEVMSRSVGGGDVVRAQTGGVVRRDPQTGYLVEDQNAMALQTMAVLREQNERIEALEAGKKGKKKAPQERPLLLDRLQPPPRLDRANVVYAEDVRDQYPGYTDLSRYSFVPEGWEHGRMEEMRRQTESLPRKRGMDPTGPLLFPNLYKGEAPLQSRESVARRLAIEKLAATDPDALSGYQYGPVGIRDVREAPEAYGTPEKSKKKSGKGRK